MKEYVVDITIRQWIKPDTFSGCSVDAITDEAYRQFLKDCENNTIDKETIGFLIHGETDLYINSKGEEIPV